MTATVLPREYGVKLTCNRCGLSVQTAMCGRKANRKWFAAQGWGRGTDPGQRPSEAIPERSQSRVITRNGVKIEYEVKLKSRPGRPGRPSTKKHDLCPDCVKLDREAAKQRKADRAARIAARDAKRKERDLVMRGAR